MSEVTFAKQFLATLDKRPIKLSADHISDPKKYPSQSPYILPKQTHPFPRRAFSNDGSTPAKSISITVTIKPMRSGETVVLSDLDLNATIHELKAKYAQKTGLTTDKIKLMYNKKPATDLKTLKELGVEGGSVELSAMIMGGTVSSATATTTGTSANTETKIPVVAPAIVLDPMEIDGSTPGPDSENAKVLAEATSSTSNAEETPAQILKGDAFWDDLGGFLVQRLRDEQEGKKLAGLFRNAYQKL